MANVGTLGAMDDKTRLQFGDALAPMPGSPTGGDSSVTDEDRSHEDAEALVGSVIDKRYRIEALLAVGGMGAVYRAEQVFIHKKVALKLLHQSFAADPDAVERFRREAQIAAQLASDNVVDVIDFGRTEEGRFYLTMELLPGESLQALLDREGRVPAARTTALLRQILAGLGAAHAAGIVHRDLKPENLWLVPSAGGEQVKILDFGIAKLTEVPLGASSTQAGVVMGTPEFLAPEQAFGHPLDHRADLYAVGLIAFVLLTGRHPYQADTLRGMMMAHAMAPVPPLAEAAPDLADRMELAMFIARATEKKPEMRPQSSAEMLEILDGRVVPAPPPKRRDAATDLQARKTKALSLARGLRGVANHWPAMRARVISVVHALVSRLRSFDLKQIKVIASREAAGRAITGRRLLAGLAILVAVGVLGVIHFRDPMVRARRALGAGDPERALTLLATAGDSADVVGLRGHALHALRRSDEGFEAYRLSASRDPKILNDKAVISDLTDDLRGNHSQEAARLLVQAGDPAVDPLVSASADPQNHRRRWAAIEALRTLGKADRVDLVAAYVADLRSHDCSIVSHAARSLGDLGSDRARGAVPALKEVADKKVARFFDACGADSARAALRKLEP